MIDHNPYSRPTADTACSTEGFLYLTWEREAIRVARENGHLAPWTDDPVLAKYKFTNIHRRDDRVSKWIIEHLIEPAVDSGDDHLWFTLLIARLINWPPTLQTLLDCCVIPCAPEDFDPERFSAVLEDCKADGTKVYSGAYMLYPGKQGHANKSEFLAKTILHGAIFRAKDITGAVQTNFVENVVIELSKCFGISTFIAGQVCSDLTYAPGPLARATDLYTYAPMGPGSQRGLNFLHGKALNHSWKQIDFNLALMDLGARIHDDLGITDLTLHDVQNICCEYSKYVKAVTGQGNPKSTYKSETQF